MISFKEIEEDVKEYFDERVAIGIDRGMTEVDSIREARVLADARRRFLERKRLAPA